MGRHAERLVGFPTTEAVAHCRVTDSGQAPKRPLKPKKMLKIGFRWVTANRGKPDASDLRATGFRRDRLRHKRIAKCVPLAPSGSQDHPPSGRHQSTWHPTESAWLIRCRSDWGAIYKRTRRIDHESGCSIQKTTKNPIWLTTDITDCTDKKRWPLTIRGIRVIRGQSINGCWLKLGVDWSR